MASVQNKTMYNNYDDNGDDYIDDNDDDDNAIITFILTGRRKYGNISRFD